MWLKKLVIIVASFLVIIFLISRIVPVSPLTPVKNSLLFLFKIPVQVAGAFFNIFDRKATFNTLSRENKYLTQELGKAEFNATRLNELSKENERLRSVLDFKNNATYKALGAEVIGQDPNSFSRIIIIDKGLKHGLRPDMAVITFAGIVGRLIEAGSQVSKVMLITDPNSRIGARIARTREEGLLIGTLGANCRLRYLSLDSDTKIGDEVVVAGGGIYPKGILVGKVISVGQEADGLSLYAVVKPEVKFSRLEEVLCLE